MKQLLLRCDDFGTATGADLAIAELAGHGTPINISVMICGPMARSGMELLRHAGPHICLGIHATVNAEWDGIKWGAIDPSSLGSGLTNAQGHFHAFPRQLEGVAPEAILREVRAQIVEALSWDLPFAYLDEHMGFGRIHNLRDSLGKLAEEFGLVWRPKLPQIQVDAQADDLVASWRKGLAAADTEPCLLVTHPGIADASTAPFYLPGSPPGKAPRQRQAEYEALKMPAWTLFAREPQVRLLTYRDLSRS
jgi:predicted glycoside hydrolase/deacetylase ChbG (UPF0249 family)